MPFVLATKTDKYALADLSKPAALLIKDRRYEVTDELLGLVLKYEGGIEVSGLESSAPEEPVLDTAEDSVTNEEENSEEDSVEEEDSDTEEEEGTPEPTEVPKAPKGRGRKSANQRVESDE
jgi:hypothetical protein